MKTTTKAQANRDTIKAKANDYAERIRILAEMITATTDLEAHEINHAWGTIGTLADINEKLGAIMDSLTDGEEGSHEHADIADLRNDLEEL